MSHSRHKCSLYFKNDFGLPKLAPNAHWFKRLCRVLWKLILINLNHTKCKKLFRNKAAILRERRRHASGPHFFVIHPLSTLNAILDAMFVILWLYFLIVEPLLTFSDRKTYQRILNVHRKMISPLQLILILLFFNRGYIDTKTNHVVLESKKIIRRYLFTYFIFDYLSTYLALDIPLGWIVANKNRNYAQMHSFFIRIFAYSIRIPTLIKYVDELLSNLKFKETLRSLFCYTLKTYIILHLFTYMIVAVPMLTYIYLKLFPHRSWLIKTGVLFKKRMHQKYFETFRMVCCFFFGIPYIFMEVLNEQICAVIISFTGRLYTLYLLADILRVLGIVGTSESMYQRSMSLIENYMANQYLPNNLKQRIIGYCKFKFQGRYFQEAQIKNTLSDNLRAELFLFVARKMTQKSAVFKNLPSSTIGNMMEVLKLEIFPPNDIIIKIGSEISEVYFISSGTVAVMTSDGKELCHLEDGEEFGTSCIFFKKQKYAMVAIETTEVFVIDKNKLMEFLCLYPDVMNGFYRSIKQKLAKLKNLEECATTEQISLISELEKGNILEQRTKRLTTDD